MGGADVITRDCNYIKGGWQRASGTEKFEVTDSTTEEIIGTVTAATSGDADAAVAAARAAFPEWSALPPGERAGYLQRAAEGLQSRQSDIAVLVSREVGMPFAYSNVIQAGLPVLSFVSMAELALASNSVNLFRRHDGIYR